jgi:PPOX class probable F420-dependent enzyme
MTDEERDEFLRTQRTCRIGTVGADGAPHVSPLWFVWDGTSIWLYSLSKSQRWRNVERDPRVSVVVDGGHAYGELQGVEVMGRVVPVGGVPWTGEPEPELDGPTGLWAAKYSGGRAPGPDANHTWARITPDKLVTWDFQKLPGPGSSS